MIRKYVPILFVLLFTAFLMLQGCEEPTSIIAEDKIKVMTRPYGVTKELLRMGLCYGEDGVSSKNLQVKLSDLQGFAVYTPEETFDPVFVPDKLIEGHHFFGVEYDPIHFKTNMTFVSRNVYKRTDVEYNHLLKVAGEPLLRDDAVKIAVGTIGVPKKGGCYLALLDLVSERVKRVVPSEFTRDELEKGRIVPVAWERQNIHAVLMLQEGRAIYFTANNVGKIAGTVALEGAYIAIDETPTGWRITTPGGRPFLIGFKGGYFLVDQTSWKATYFNFATPTKLLGTTDGGRELLLVAYDSDFKRPTLYRRYPIGGNVGKPMPYGWGGRTGGMENVMFSQKEGCIFFVEGKDIWRMDLNSGVQGKMFDTPDEDEVLLWVW